MRALARLLALLIVTSLLVSGAASAGGDTRNQGIELTPGALLLTAVNNVRETHGLTPLRASVELERAARAHSVAMLTSGRFAHTSADGTSFGARVRRYYSPTGFASWTAAENLLTSTSVLSAQRAVALWLQSPPHRRNLLDPALRDAGIGAAFTRSARGDFGRGGAWVVTLDLGHRTGRA
jgi:uncharacterized protein YkwD